VDLLVNASDSEVFVTVDTDSRVDESGADNFVVDVGAVAVNSVVKPSVVLVGMTLVTPVVNDVVVA
jgi:hypothetical protein